MTSAFYWRDVNRRGCASSRQRRFNCATSSTQLPAELTDFNKLLSLQKLKSKKKEGKKGEKSHQLLSVRVEYFYYARLVSLPLKRCTKKEKRGRKKDRRTKWGKKAEGWSALQNHSKAKVPSVPFPWGRNELHYGYSSNGIPGKRNDKAERN